MATLLENAKEGSTYILLHTFKDESDVSYVPVSANWSLRKNDGSIVNSRTSVVITPATTVSVVLSGADLAYNPDTSTFRTLTIQGVYNSTYGSGLPFADEYTINITPLTGITDI